MPRHYIARINNQLAKITAGSAMLSMLQKVVLLCLVTGSLGLLWSCASTKDIVYKLYPGPERPDTELVTLYLGDATEVVIDGMKVSQSDYGTVKLLPGPHEIQWKSWFGVSVLIEPSGYAIRESEDTVEFKAGQAYILKADRTTGYGYRTFLWIEDVGSGKVIAGTKKP